MVGANSKPKESVVFLVVVVGLLVFAMLWGRPDRAEERAEYRLRECVVNLEQIVIHQEEIREATGRYLDCPSFPVEVPGDQPVLWKVRCDSDKYSTTDGEVRFADCKVGELCEADLGCVEPGAPIVDHSALVPVCWGQLMGLKRDTMVRGQYRAEAPFAVDGVVGARFDLTCRTDLSGEGVITQYRATESKTTWMDRELAR